MIAFVKQIYKFKILNFVIDTILNSFIGTLFYKRKYNNVEKLRLLIINDLLSFYREHQSIDNLEFLEAITFLNNNRDIKSVFPYSFVLEYRNAEYKVYVEKSYMKYVWHKGKKLFYPKHLPVLAVQTSYSGLVIEQDKRSPHSYLSESFQLSENCILFDVGAAEGIFVLEHIEDIKHAYLFECEDKWIEALNRTFEPWKEKVTIVKKYISNKCSETEITIDAFVRQINQSVNFIKMDIEGAEYSALEGATETLGKMKNLKLAVCLYHKQEDEKMITDFFIKQHYNYVLSEGVMLMGKRPPFFRKAIIRADKTKI